MGEGKIKRELTVGVIVVALPGVWELAEVLTESSMLWVLETSRNESERSGIKDRRCIPLLMVSMSKVDEIEKL